ncbi:MAG: ATP-binding protein [Saccharospirillum sp.]
MTRAQNDLFATETLPSSAYILTHLDLYNWGPFSGRHCAEIDPKGTAIIGPTGSGKTTLVDALMTLLTHQPKYNLASTGGHESDRDLISYIRGVAGAGNKSGDNSHIARPGKTVTGVSARFSNGPKNVRIGALFWVEGSSSASGDLKRLWLFTDRDDTGLDDWLASHHEGGARDLKQRGRELPGLHINDSKRAYLAQVRRFFEVGENAFTLLNRAAGLKQLNSIDEIFRELVLDDHSAFDRAAEVASEFDDLATIHAELITAREQHDSLVPIAELHQRHQSTQQELKQQTQLKAILPVWFAQAGQVLWEARLTRLDDNIADSQQRLKTRQASIETLQGQADTLKDIYLKAGGASIEQLKEQIGDKQRWVAEREQHANDYRNVTRSLKLDDTVSAQALAANQQAATSNRNNVFDALAEQEQSAFDVGAQLSEHKKQQNELQSEIELIKSRPGSNIEGRFQAFRSDLATALNLSDDDLPFVAELVEVKPEEKAWRGAIERALGSHRLRLLVPPAAMKTALNWVNHRDNRLHVRLLEAETPASQAQFMDDGYTRKLNFKAHPHREALKKLLASLDRHCVDTPEALRETQHAMTQQGLMSGKQGQFEKQDQKRLDQGWMTGFDNRDRLAALTEALNDATVAVSDAQRRLDEARQTVKHSKEQLQLYDRLLEVRFDSIDSPSAKADLARLEDRLRELTAPDSDVEKARRKYEQTQSALGSERQKIADEQSALGGLKAQRDDAAKRCAELATQVGEGLSEDEQALGDAHFTTPNGDQYDRLDALERALRAELEQQIGKLQKQLSRLEQDLIRQMNGAKGKDTGALTESGTEIRDIPHFLERLRVLKEEALPAKLERFLNYLNQSSDQGVTQLLAHIQNEVTVIEERIADLNITLQRVDFQTGRYLRLEPKRVTHESLRTLEKAQRHLRAAALKDDQGESHFKALAHLVQLLRHASDNKRTVGARALLDPRYRLQFEVSVLDRESHAVIETRTGSQGGSGGEKEIIASYILTASLSYALCPDGATQPLFGTIVLDEAFSKSSHAVAGRIISALNEFGLHPLFVTPNKEMRLLRAHTRSAILVHRKALRATLTSLSWEELETHAEQFARKTHEVTG